MHRGRSMVLECGTDSLEVVVKPVQYGALFNAQEGVKFDKLKYFPKQFILINGYYKIHLPIIKRNLKVLPFLSADSQQY